MKVKFFGGPVHRKKYDMPDPLQSTYIIAQPEYQNVYWGADSPYRIDPVGIKRHHYRLHEIRGESQSFFIYVHQDTSIDEVLKKALG